MTFGDVTQPKSQGGISVTAQQLSASMQDRAEVQECAAATAAVVAATCAGIIICMIRDLLPKRAAKWVPSPMAMSIPFYIGAASVSKRHWFSRFVWPYYDTQRLCI